MIPLIVNWVDLLIVAVFIYFIFEARRVGFWYILADFVSFLGSLIIALVFYSSISEILKSRFSIPRSIANPIGFLILSVLSEGVLGIILAKVIMRIPEKLRKNKYFVYFEIFPVIGETVIISAFFLLLAISLPITPRVKIDISASRIGGFLVRETSVFEVKLSEIFGGAVEDSLTYLTVKPDSREAINIPTGEIKLSTDEKAEGEMFKLVNEERKKLGIKELGWRPEVVPVAREHATDMWERKYFGHISPEGKNIGDRLDKAGTSYIVAGENLALSPTVQIAHKGLMNSQGHRENILSLDFNRVGIGVIDNGFYGKMFVQIFTN